VKKQRGRDRGKDEDGIERVTPELHSAELSYPEGVERREHYYELYPPLVGPVGNVTPIKAASGKKKKPKAPAGPITDAVMEETKARKERYDTFIDYMIEYRGNRVQALAATYGVPESLMLTEFRKYMTDVQLGMTTSSVSNLLEDAGIGKAARIALLANHAYSEDPKVSLVATKLATDLDGDKHDRGTTYEQYVRMIKGRGP
jgi:hypothetical protein